MGGYADLWNMPLPLIIAIGMFKSWVFELARIGTQYGLYFTYGIRLFPCASCCHSIVQCHDPRQELELDSDPELWSCYPRIC
jgi:hypothetical protein